ncbi:S66 family peptidase [Alteribacter populi]|uniref:S66 family peptidase n=1 Tax=Alteribacter populi TaxID=2011011 RepID=UPI000BBAF7A8|nr:S66 peptidase family protein [Alteribacter populi]
MTIPSKLQAGDEVRVVSPATSLAVISDHDRNLAVKRLQALGLNVTFGRYADESDRFHSSSVESRLTDLHEAFEDPNVKGILTTLGGLNSNQLLRDLDYDVIRRNPKILCGYSDITALSNAIYTKTGLMTYSGPHFSTFGMKKGIDYTLEYFIRCMFESVPFKVKPSESWSDDDWYLDQNNRTFIGNDGFQVITKGKAEGKIIGGNLCTLNLLQGTEYMPDLEGSILFLEDDNDVSAQTFDRDLQSLIHLPAFKGVRGLVIGRFQKASEITLVDMMAIIGSKPELASFPVVSNVDFGHTTPHITFPVGGTAKLEAISEEEISIDVVEH